MTTIKLKDLIDEIECQTDESQSFINLKTGEVCFITDEIMHFAETSGEKDNALEWQKEQIKIAKHYLENQDDYLPLPDQRDADEYRMMENFACSLEDEKISGQLLISLKGQGAFRRFKDSVILLGIEKEWYQFKDEQYRQFAIRWCEYNEINLQTD